MNDVVQDLSASFALVSGDEQVRTVLPSILERRGGLRYVGQAQSLSECVDCVHGLNPDVVILDGRLHSVDDVFVCRELRAASPHTSLLLLVPYVFRRDQILAVIAGASACVAKEPGSWHLLATTIQQVTLGQRFFVPGVFAYQTGSRSYASPYRLSVQEEALFADLLSLKTDGQIMEEKNLTLETIRQGISALTRKLLEP